MTGGTTGVLLAAGRGQRMGALKQLLPWGTGAAAKPLVAAAFDALAPACDTMIVVAGEDHPAIVEALHPREFTTVIVDSNREMFESIRAGLRKAQRLWPESDVLLHPADQPVIHPAIVEALRAEARRHPNAAVMPEYIGRGGHPVLIPADMLAAIIAWSGPGGLRSFWENHPRLARRVAINDASVLLDIDNPQEYAHAMDDVSGGAGRPSS